MNIHPMFVHFPIALLTVYALAEIIWYKRLVLQEWWWNFKATLLLLGTLGGFAALQTGELAEELRSRSDLIEIHSTYATITIWIFAALLLSYVVKFVRVYMPSVVQSGWKAQVFSVVEPLGVFIEKISLVLAIVGLATLTITGALGGVIVYGPNVDPVVHFIYSIVVNK